MSGHFTTEEQRGPQNIIEYDAERAKQIAEEKVRQSAYDFALSLNINWNEQDILREAKKLAIEVAALKSFEQVFEQIIQEIEGER